jgi:hypothetical protein
MLASLSIRGRLIPHTQRWAGRFSKWAVDGVDGVNGVDGVDGVDRRRTARVHSVHSVHPVHLVYCLLPTRQNWIARMPLTLSSGSAVLSVA